jgi:serine/threonine protein kinase/WD40 repeat protein
MSLDNLDPNPDPPDIDDLFVDSLVGFDEQLRRGAAAPLSGLTLSELNGADDLDTSGAQACLTFLERAFPRAGHDAGSPETDRIGRFELVRILGQGGFGVVYLARDPRLGRLVALKVPRLLTLGNRTLHARFLREARAAAALDHPHITPILETGEIGPVCYIASTYCDGADLAQWLKQHAPVAPRVAARIVGALADATHYSHTRGILHRDLKPSNVLLAARNGSSGALDDELPFVPRLTDFGLARLAEEGVGETGSAVLGTPQYMAPEQAAGHSGEVCAATDVYGLGTILYELLAARPPFLGTGVVEVLDQIRSADPVPPSQLVRSIPRDLETICLKCLHKEPRGRYASAGDLRDDLQRFLGGDPIRAKPVALWERSLKWGRRHPARLAVIVVSVLSIVLLIGGLAVHLSQVEEHLQTAERLRTEGLDREATLRLQAYVGEVEAASADLAAGMLQLAHRRLEQFARPADDSTDVRGPEWHYLWEQTLPTIPALVFRGHQRPVYSVAVTADGQLAVSGDKAGVIKVWDVKTGEERKSFAAHDGEVRVLKFSPDGRHLASAGCYHFIRIWNVSDWSRAVEFDAHDGTVMSVDFSADSERLVSSGRDGEIRCWDWRHSKVLWHEQPGDVVHRVRFADGGTTVYSVHDNGILTQWEAGNGTMIHSEEMGNTGDQLLAMDLPPDSRFIVGGGYAKEVRCYDTRDHYQWALPVGEYVDSTACSSDGRHAALGSDSGQIHLLRFAAASFRGVTLRRWTAHDETITDLRFSPDAKTLYSASADGGVKIWNLDDIPAEQVSFFSETRGPKVTIGYHAIAAGVNHIATAGEVEGHGWVRLWNMAELRDEQSFEVPNIPLHGIVADPRSERLAAFCENRALLIWDNPAVDVTPRIVALPGIRGVAFAPNGSTVAVAVCLDELVPLQNSVSTVVLYNPDTGEPIRQLYSGLDRIDGLAYAPHGRTLVAGFHTSPTVILDAGSGVAKIVAGTEDGAHQFSFNAAGTLLAASRFGRFGATAPILRSGSQVYLVDTESGEVASTFRHGLAGWKTHDLAMSSDGRLLAVSSIHGKDSVGQLVLWHIESGRPIMELRPFEFVPGRLMFLSGGNSLVATSVQSGSNQNQGMLLWHLSAGRKLGP